MNRVHNIFNELFFRRNIGGTGEGTERKDEGKGKETVLMVLENLPSNFFSE